MGAGEASAAESVSTNWPYIIRKLIEGSLGLTTPETYASLTLPQLAIMLLPAQAFGSPMDSAIQLTPGQAAAVVPKEKRIGGGYRSLAHKLAEEAAAAHKAAAKDRKRRRQR